MSESEMHEMHGENGHPRGEKLKSPRVPRAQVQPSFPDPEDLVDRNPGDDHGYEWGVIQLMGHTVVAGRIREEDKFGQRMLRVDVPVMEDSEEFVTSWYSGSAIFSLMLTTEEIARGQLADVASIPTCILTMQKVQDIVVEQHERWEAKRDVCPVHGPDCPNRSRSGNRGPVPDLDDSDMDEDGDDRYLDDLDDFGDDEFDSDSYETPF